MGEWLVEDAGGHVGGAGDAEDADARVARGDDFEDGQSFQIRNRDSSNKHGQGARLPGEQRRDTQSVKGGRYEGATTRIGALAPSGAFCSYVGALS